MRYNQLVLLLVIILVLSACGEAAQPKIYDVAIYNDTRTMTGRVDGMIEAIKPLGYEEGKNIRFYKLNTFDMTAEQKQAALKEFTARSYSAYWVTSGPAALDLKAIAVKQPIVVGGMTNPVVRGLAQTVEKPGYNITGIDSLNTELTLDRMALLKKLSPNIKSIYLIYDPTDIQQFKYIDTVRAKAKTLSLVLVERPATSKEEYTSVISQLKSSEAQAILTISIVPFSLKFDAAQLKSVVEREKLVLIGGDRNHLQFGALLTYGSNHLWLGQQSASYLDRVLHGIDPAGMKIEPPSRFELVIDQKLANQFGLTIPKETLDAADEIIK